MRAIILAAGKGLRLNGLIGDAPKCLLQVGGTTLLERQISILETFGIDDIVVVVGYKADCVRDLIGPRASFLMNDIYDQTNSLYSLWLARHLIEDGFVVLNGDVLFHPRMLRRLLRAPAEDALLISNRDSASVFTDEEMKVKVRDGKIVDISKKLALSDTDGENVGIGKFGSRGAQLLIEKMNALIAQGSVRDWAPRAFLEVARERPLSAVSTNGYPWIEIDFPEDYNRAVDHILPRIESIGAVKSAHATTDDRELALNAV
ncbi:MAG TPA: phosphocholine cytidylyltransferase family protein [Blastocatellia bacterium]|nr:phosphocholine cytidylyltransferase family protein [Blastocatellia bacterium]